MAHENWGHVYDYVYERTFGHLYKRLTDETMDVVRSSINSGVILDFGAGTGRMAVPLAEAGYRVVAIEPCAPMADRIEMKSQRAGKEIPIHLCPISRYDGEIGDMALCVFTVLSYITTDEEMGKSIAVIADKLKTGGLLFVDLPQDAFFHTGIIMDKKDQNFKRYVTLYPNENGLYEYKESCSGICDGMNFEYEDHFPLRKWQWREIDEYLIRAGMQLIPKDFQQFGWTGSAYRMYRKG
jgi:SAM-dependent methyltransferase